MWTPAVLPLSSRDVASWTAQLTQARDVEPSLLAESGTVSATLALSVSVLSLTSPASNLYLVYK